MALVVETGSGSSTADSYASLAQFSAYCLNRGYRVEDYDDYQREQALRLATDYIDTHRRFKGSPSTTAQALEWPRSGATDWAGNTVTGIPARLVRACCELAFHALSESLYQNLDRGGAIASESVGPISVTYREDAPTQKCWEQAQRFLDPYVLAGENGVINGLGFETSANSVAPIFRVGMHDDTSADLAADPLA